MPAVQKKKRSKPNYSLATYKSSSLVYNMFISLARYTFASLKLMMAYIRMIEEISLKTSMHCIFQFSKGLT